MCLLHHIFHIIWNFDSNRPTFFYHALCMFSRRLYQLEIPIHSKKIQRCNLFYNIEFECPLVICCLWFVLTRHEWHENSLLSKFIGNWSPRVILFFYPSMGHILQIHITQCFTSNSISVSKIHCHTASQILSLWDLAWSLIWQNRVRQFPNLITDLYSSKIRKPTQTSIHTERILIWFATCFCEKDENCRTNVNE